MIVHYFLPLYSPPSLLPFVPGSAGKARGNYFPIRPAEFTTSLPALFIKLGLPHPIPYEPWLSPSSLLWNVSGLALRRVQGSK